MKFGKFLEKLTPDAIDNSAVEDFILNRMVQDLSKEGVKGEISIVNGLNVADDMLHLGEDLKVRNRKVF